MNTILAESLDFIATQLEAAVAERSGQAQRRHPDAARGDPRRARQRHLQRRRLLRGVAQGGREARPRRTCGPRSTRCRCSASPEVDGAVREVRRAQRARAAEPHRGLPRAVLPDGRRSRRARRSRWRSTIIFPAAIRYQGELAATCANLKAVGYKFDTDTLDKMTALVKELQDGIAALEKALAHHGGASKLDARQALLRRGAAGDGGGAQDRRRARGHGRRRPVAAGDLPGDAVHQVDFGPVRSALRDRDGCGRLGGRVRRSGADPRMARGPPKSRRGPRGSGCAISRSGRRARRGVEHPGAPLDDPRRPSPSSPQRPSSPERGAAQSPTRRGSRGVSARSPPSLMLALLVVEQRPRCHRRRDLHRPRRASAPASGVPPSPVDFDDVNTKKDPAAFGARRYKVRTGRSSPARVGSSRAGASASRTSSSRPRHRTNTRPARSEKRWRRPRSRSPTSCVSPASPASASSSSTPTSPATDRAA